MKINDLTLAFKNKIILKDVNIAIGKGEFVFFIGYSGSGKTSVIRSLIGDFKPYSGNVILENGLDLYKNMTEETLLEYRRSIGVIFQDYKLLESKKVYENVAFAMEVCGYSDSVIQKRVPEALEQVGLLIKKDKFIYELSGGEKQRVAIARAIVNNPSVIIGDEPTGNLDPDTALEVMRIFEDLHEEGKTIILATHDKHIVDSMKKRVICFGDQKIMSDIERGKYIL
ncbi:ATP-binding cassette domain-containing protein [Candidatus Gracilibacteria bacterium]|nr:ATP-binding cassette domain-containing protein [Candidatus Gracilibacteria bacterium]